MKYKGDDEMLPWRDRRGRETEAATIEDRAAALIAGALSPAEPDALSLLRVEQALFRPERRRPRSRPLVRVAVVTAVLVAFAATVKAYEMARRSGWLGWAVPTSARLPGKPTSGKGGLSAPAPTEPAPAALARSAEALGGQAQGETQPGLGAEALAGAKGIEVVPIPEARAASKPGTASGEARVAVATPEPAGAEAGALVPLPSSTMPGGTAAHGAGLRRSKLGEARLAWASPHASSRAEAPAEGHGERKRAASPSGRREESSARARAGIAPAAMSSATAEPADAPPRLQAASVSDEVHALDRALALLRREHDGGAALLALDAYLARYPHGLLSREAHFARVDALLLLGRSDQALAALEALPLDRGARSTELQVIRGELRARRNCASANADFSAALAQSPTPALLERILYGRGVCRSKLGNVSGAASDLQRYLDRFPNGVHARSARLWLQSVGVARSPEP